MNARKKRLNENKKGNKEKLEKMSEGKLIKGIN